MQDSIEEYLAKGYSYARTNNPTVTVLENKIAELEGGAGAACFGTGMAATIAVVSGMMNAGDHCVITNCSYGGTNRACRTMFTDMGMSFDFIDFTDIANIEAHIKPNTKLIFSESPANPTLTLTDIPAVSAVAKSRGIAHVVDSTFATPVIQRPIELGADLVIQSTTKFCACPLFLPSSHSSFFHTSPPQPPPPKAHDSPHLAQMMATTSPWAAR